MATGDPTDPNNPTPDPSGFEAVNNAAQNSNNTLNQYNLLIAKANDGTEMFNQTTTLTQQFLDGVEGGLEAVSDRLRNFSREGANAFSILGVAITGASLAFNQMTDTTSLSNFSSQLDYMVRSVMNLGRTVPGMSALVDLAKQLGVNITPRGTSMREYDSLAEKVRNAARNIGVAADNSLKLQNTFFGLMAATGQLNEVFGDGERDLSNLNDRLRQQSQLITGVYGATGVLLPVLGTYYEMLGKIPGALTQQVAAGGDATKMTSLFQQAVQVAHGTGMQFSEVVKNMTTAWEDYNLTGNDALVFTARMSEMANNFGIRLTDTEGFMTKMADAFKLLGNNADGTSKIFTEFFGRLRDTGLGVKPAMDIIEGMTGAIARMNVAQRAFISGRTGGPGGLLGAIQIERELRQGNAEEVFSRIRTALLQQFGGRIITQDQVRTQADAAQFERQRQLLQSGAFGGLAANEDQATRLLEALKAGPGTQAFKTGTDLLKQSVDTGAQVEQKSLTQLVQINKHLEDIKQQGGISALGVLQQGFTAAGTGALRTQLQGNIAEAARMGAEATAPGPPGDTSLEQIRRAAGGLVDSVGGLSTSLASASEAARDAFIHPPDRAEMQRQAEADYAQERQELERRIATIQNMPGGTGAADRQREIQAIRAREAELQANLQNAQRGAMEPARAARVGAAAATAAQAQAVQAREAPRAGAGPARAPATPEQLNATINVYIDGKKVQADQHTVNMTGGTKPL